MKFLWFILLPVLLPSFSRAQSQACPYDVARQHLGMSRPRVNARSIRYPLRMESLPSIDLAPNFSNIQVTHDPSNDQDEPSISVNPHSPSAITIGGVDDRSFDVLWSYSSTGGGLGWLEQALPSGPLTNDILATDPGVVFDNTGKLYYANVFSSDTGPNEEACYTSIDAGQVWSSSVFVGGDTQPTATTEADRDYITVDRDSASPYYGRVYITWVVIEYPYSYVVEAYSTDQGASWSSTVSVSPHTGLFQGPIPSCGPNGELYITYVDRDSNSREVLVARSTDGGTSFQPQTVVQPYLDLGPEKPNNFIGHPVIKGLLEVNSFPVIAVDHSALYHGRVYITWCAKSPDGHAHVFLSSSDDEAQSWTTPQFAEDDSSATSTDKFFPWIAVDQTTGDAGIIFYDSRNDAANNSLVDTYLTLSTDGGNTFQSRRISNTSFDPHITRDFLFDSLIFFGDYIGLDAVDHQWYPTWTDSRSGYDQEIYMSIVRPYAPVCVSAFTGHGDASTAYLNWTYNPETTFGLPLSNYHFRLTRDDGRLDTMLDRSTLQFVDNAYRLGVTYRIQAVAATGDTSTTVSTTIDQSAVKSLPNTSSLFSIGAMLANPVRLGDQQHITLTLAESCEVSAEVYDALGKRVEFQNGIEYGAGPAVLALEYPAMGVYWVRITARSAGRTETELHKIVVLP
jgi:hypothetical protein